MMVEAVAHELGALLLNLSPDNLKGTFPGKNGPTKLIHMAFTVARYSITYS
jgi:IQ and AAA domain-containing protein